MATALAEKAAPEWSGESQPMQWRNVIRRKRPIRTDRVRAR